MLSERTVSIADAYWASHFGCPTDELFAEPFRILTHGAELADYCGVFALFREGSVIISIPSDRADTLRNLLFSLRHGCSPDSFASALGPVSSAVVGPAYVGYASAVPLPVHPARALGPDDAAALDAFQQGCDATEWEHGGSPIEHPCSAVFVGEQIAALAGYEVWGGTIAHISIVTHPDFRSRGFGRSAVAHLAGRAIAAGLLPQYRTLESNHPSIRIAESLGFHCYATSMAARVHRNACQTNPTNDQGEASKQKLDPMTIRLLDRTDALVLDGVAPGVFDHAIDPRRFPEFLADPRHHLAVALLGGQVIGMASAVHYVHPDKGPELWVNEVGVAPAHQRQGIGKQLMEALFAHGQTLGCREAWVLTEEDNVAARRLYEAVGGKEKPAVLASFQLAQCVQQPS